MKLKPLTEKSWLVLTDDGLQRIALLSEQKDKLVLIAKGAKTLFTNREEVSKFFKEDIFDNLIKVVEDKHDVEYFIDGYLADFKDPVKASDDVCQHLPLYTKTATSTIKYAAGFYCLGSGNRWGPIFCPKLSTINKYECKGPFKSEKEMKFVLKRLRRCII